MSPESLVIRGESAAMAVLQDQGDPTETWLRELPDRKAAAILQYTAQERSPVLSYLYASLLGYDGSVDDWEAFVIARFDKLDHRKLLEAETMRLQEDIGSIREAIEMGKIRVGDGPTKISYLSRELRGHIETLAKDQLLHDKRSLLLAGVEVASKMLRATFGKDGSVWPAIEATLEGAWAAVEDRHKAK
jgi:hypothetical protein